MHIITMPICWARTPKNIRHTFSKVRFPIFMCTVLPPNAHKFWVLTEHEWKSCRGCLAYSQRNYAWSEHICIITFCMRGETEKITFWKVCQPKEWDNWKHIQQALLKIFVLTIETIKFLYVPKSPTQVDYNM